MNEAEREAFMKRQIAETIECKEILDQTHLELSELTGMVRFMTPVIYTHPTVALPDLAQKIADSMVSDGEINSDSMWSDFDSQWERDDVLEAEVAAGRAIVTDVIQTLADSGALASAVLTALQRHSAPVPEAHPSAADLEWLRASHAQDDTLSPEEIGHYVGLALHLELCSECDEVVQP